MTFLRRLRGVTSTALLWAATWGLVGTAAYAVLGVRWTLDLSRPLSVSEVLPYALTGALFLTIYGLLSGAAFAGVLMLSERGRRVQDLSTRRVAAWGALGGIGILSLNAAVIYLSEGGRIPSDMIPVLIIVGMLGAGCAAGSLVLARRAPRPESGDETSRGALSSEQPRLNGRSHEAVHAAAPPVRATVERSKPQPPAA